MNGLGAAIYFLGMPLTAGLMGGLGNYCNKYDIDSNVVCDVCLMIIWPGFWVWQIMHWLGRIVSALGKFIAGF
jgi:hypothetical protein